MKRGAKLDDIRKIILADISRNHKVLIKNWLHLLPIHPWIIRRQFVWVQNYYFIEITDEAGKAGASAAESGGEQGGVSAAAALQPDHHNKQPQHQHQLPEWGRTWAAAAAAVESRTGQLAPQQQPQGSTPAVTQFSETRQLGFFKPKRHNDRNKSNSPYVIHKVRTQDIKQVNKIYGGKNMKDTLANFHKNETIAHIRPDDKLGPAPPSVLEKIITRPDSTITDKLYHPKKNPRI
jgi:hypothetical protein